MDGLTKALSRKYFCRMAFRVFSQKVFFLFDNLFDFFDKTLLFDGWSIGGLFWLVKKYFASLLSQG